MKIRLVWIDKTKDRRLAELIEDYLHRLAKYVKYDISELAASRNQTERVAVLNFEAKAIFGVLSPDAYKIVLDERGQSYSSQGLSKLLIQRQNAGTREVVFIIGGHFGLAETVKQDAQALLSLSAMTFTHDMARLILVEQLYRAYTIISGHPYQK